MALLLISALVTAALYWIDSDKPSDTVLQIATVMAVVFAVITALYCCIYGILKGRKQKAARAAAQP